MSKYSNRTVSCAVWIIEVLFLLGLSINLTTVKPVYSGHLGKCPEFPGQFTCNGYFKTITKCPDYGGVPIFINRFHSM